jgi:allantoate deiminase
VLGVTIAIGLAELVQEHSFQFDIEIIGFSEEEGVRFGVPFLGSRAVAGTLPASLLERCDGLGRTMADAIRTFGLDPSCLADVAQRPSSAYLEFHIEQGPVLDELNLPLGVVTAIAGQSRLEVTFKGETNHAGTTPMHLRHDTITGVAEWILQVERTAGADRDLVATVGSLVITPGAANVIAGETRATLDVRSAIDSKRTAAVDCILGSAREVASRRGLEVTSETRLYQPAVACDAGLQQMLARAVESVGYPVHKMVSGAGHDAMIMAHRMPMGMLFLRSPGGISHHSSETVRTEDVAAALQVGRHFVKAWRPDNA